MDDDNKETWKDPSVILLFLNVISVGDLSNRCVVVETTEFPHKTCELLDTAAALLRLDCQRSRLEVVLNVVGERGVTSGWHPDY